MLRRTAVFVVASFVLATFAPFADARGGGGGGGRGGGGGGRSGSMGGATRAAGKRGAKSASQGIAQQNDALRRDNQRRGRHSDW